MTRRGKTMSQPFETSKMLLLRKVTRAISERLETQLISHLGTLSPLVQPRTVFGKYLRSSVKQSVKEEAESFEQVRSIYASLAGQAPFNLPKELDSPLDIPNTSLEVIPAEYSYVAQSAQERKTVMVKSPLKWVVSYSGFGLKRLRQLLSHTTENGEQLQACVVHFLAMQVTLSKRPGVARILESLRFPLTTVHMEEFGELPITCIESPIATICPPDDVIVQITEISGASAFEEVVSLEDIVKLCDPLKEEALEIIRSAGCELPTGASAGGAQKRHET